MTRLLIRQRVKNTVAILDVLVRRNRVQIVDIDLKLQPFAAAFYRNGHFVFHIRVEPRLQRHEFGDLLAFDADENVAGLQEFRGRRAGKDLLDDEKPGLVRVRLPHARFGFAVQTEPARFGVWLVEKLRLQRPARHVASFLDLRQRVADPVERQKEARCRLIVRSRIQCDDAALDIDDGRSRGAARSPRCGLQIKGVEVVVAAAAVVWRLPVEPCDRPCQDGQLFARVVADHADVAADLGRVGNELKLSGLHELQVARRISEQAEVVNRIAVHGDEIDLLLIEKYRLRPNRSRSHDVTVRKNQSALGVNHKARGLAGLVALRVECARAVDADGHDGARNTLERAIPALILSRRRHCGQRGDRDDSEAELVHSVSFHSL